MAGILNRKYLHVTVLLRSQRIRERDLARAKVAVSDHELATLSAQTAAARQRAVQLQQQADTLAWEAQQGRNEATALEQQLQLQLLQEGAARLNLG